MLELKLTPEAELTRSRAGLVRGWVELGCTDRARVISYGSRLDYIHLQRVL